MASQKQSLTADDVDANPSIIRHPDARLRIRNRSGQAAGAYKEHIPGPFSWRLIEMQESPAYRALSLSARKVLDRLEIEFERHGRKAEENGALPCTYDHLVEYGVNRNMIAPAIRELIALGFVQITRKGSAGNAEYREVTLFLLTYRPFGSAKYVANGWRRISTLDEAEAISAAARCQSADARASEFGRKGGLASQAKKQNPSHGNRTETSPESGLKDTAVSPERGLKRGQTVSPETGPPLECPGGEPKTMKEATMSRQQPDTLTPRGPTAAPILIDVKFPLNQPDFDAPTPNRASHPNAPSDRSAAPTKLAWTKPVVRELFGEEKRKRLEEFKLADLRADGGASARHLSTIAASIAGLQ